MNYFKSSYNVKLLLVSLLTLTALASVLYAQYLIGEIQEKERSSVELWAKAMEYNSRPHYSDTRRELQIMAMEIAQQPMLPESTKRRWKASLNRAETDLANAALDFVASELIIKNRFEIPSVVTDDQGEILHHRNVDERRLSPKLVAEYAALNEPITIALETGNGAQKQMIYFGESALITTLKFFPFIQFGLLALFLGIGYLALSSIKKNEQSNLWVGMAKEAAHQLGTPLSSLYGWLALMREITTEKELLNIVHELQNDAERLQIVTDRFNKIGSAPELRKQRVMPILERVTDYLKRRLPQFGKHIQLDIDFKEDVKTAINAELFTWAIENVVKNAMDAIDTSKSEAVVGIKSYVKEGYYVIEISDNGKGIEKSHLKEIFNPGFSTKVRGWGLGLSLTRRIVEEYHNGKIQVVKSVPGEGTLFRIQIPITD